MITRKNVEAARDRISSYINHTPLLRVEALDQYLYSKVFLKPENLQKTGSFKLRGAMNKLLVLTDEEKEAGVVAASSGNHAQGVAYAAKLLDIDATIVMPEDVNPVKVNSVKELGADFVLHGKTSSERDSKARKIAENENKTIVPPFSDDYIRAGQGTIALEILEDMPQMNKIVVPIGGGGLISGIAIAAKDINPEIQIIGIEPEGAKRYTESLKVNQPIALDEVDTIADGTKTDIADPENFEIIKKYVDKIITVSDKDIRAAMKLLVSKGKIVAESSSVMGIAGATTEALKLNPEENVCFVLSGGNNDLSLLAEVLSE